MNRSPLLPDHLAGIGGMYPQLIQRRTGAFLLSDMSDGITGETLHIDGGYNAMGSPGRLLDLVKTAQQKA